MKIGDRVKIYDIGTPAEVLAVEADQLYLSLDGEDFWCPLSIIDREEAE